MFCQWPATMATTPPEHAPHVPPSLHEGREFCVGPLSCGLGPGPKHTDLYNIVVGSRPGPFPSNR